MKRLLVSLLWAVGLCAFAGFYLALMASYARGDERIPDPGLETGTWYAVIVSPTTSTLRFDSSFIPSSRLWPG